jgi:hypothetical protein
MPFEIFTFLGSTVLAGLMKMWSMKIQEDKLKDQLLAIHNNSQYKAWKDARETTNKGVQFTRRVIALTAVFAIILWPKIAAVFFPEISVTLGWMEWKSGVLFFTEGKHVMHWETVRGILITPLDTNLVSAIAGLYFGGSIAGRNKG